MTEGQKFLAALCGGIAIGFLGLDVAIAFLIIVGILAWFLSMFGWYRRNINGPGLPPLPKKKKK